MTQESLDDLVLKIPGRWDLLESIRSALRQRLVGMHRDLRDASMMVATELTENAIKYGQQTEECREATFRCSLSPAHIVMEVRSGLQNERQYDRIRHKIEEIGRAKDPLILYVERMRDLMERDVSRGSAGLGLCRIAAEGKFGLECAYHQHVLTITARRPLG